MKGAKVAGRDRDRDGTPRPCSNCPTTKWTPSCAPLVPLTLNRRDGFLQAVAAALASHPGEVGPGVVHRVCAEVQRQHFDPPDFSHAGSVSKYR